MLSRFLSAAIIFFWITMTVLLVRSELWPGQSKLRSIPIEHVAKLFWLHQQASDLTIWSDHTRVGHLHLHPKIRKGDGVRILEYSGNLQLHLPGSRQRISWDGIATFDDQLALSSLVVGVGVRESSLMRATVTVTPSENLARYQLFNNEIEIEHEDYALDESGLKKLLKQLELDPALYESVRGNAVVPVVSAQQSSLKIRREERIDTFLLSLKQGGQTLLEAHVNQLGNVMKVKTLVGYNLATEELQP